MSTLKMKNLTRSRETEQILCTPTERDKEKLWLFRPYETSALWEQSLGENWFLVMYDEYYKDFWAPLFEFLGKQDRKSMVLELTVNYQWGLTENTTANLVDQLVNDKLSFHPTTRKYEHVTSLGLEFVAFRNTDNDQVMVIHLLATGVSTADAPD